MNSNFTRPELSAAIATSATDSSPARSNLVFVFSDQQSYELLGSSDNPQILTPQLDAFARKSVCVRPLPARGYRYDFEGTLLTHKCATVFDENRAYY